MEDDEPGDAELLRSIGAGDQRALSKAFDRHSNTVARYAWALAPSRMDVEEIVQDTFLALWRRGPEIALLDRSLLPWLLVTCRNIAANAGRKRARAAADALPDEWMPAHLSIVRADQARESAREELRWVLDAIERLEPVDRRVCELCLLDGLPYAQAATELGLSVGAVKQRVSRSRIRLRKAVTVDEN
ncbi:RNA polymerase sigma factor [Agromyces sp. NPDC127015]|uniref:RNA polymerase sigma factor n=1 Tax=Agromyces sp. NPDC127015 TaxID=3347108 RepID=UPI00365BB448